MRFPWHEIMTTDVAKAQAFYEALFGWKAEVTPMAGTEFNALYSDGVNFGGIWPVPSPEVPSHWVTTIAVEDIDAAMTTAVSMGATVLMETMDMEDIGRVSLIADPQGAVVGLYTPKDGSDVSQPTGFDTPPGGIVWHELATTDVEGAREFYGKVVGWGSLDRDMGTMIYSLFTESANAMVAGFMPKPEHVPVSNWGLYFYVPDPDAAVVQIKALGGQIFSDVVHIPGTGRMTWGADPTGGNFAIMTPEMPAVNE